MDATVIVETQGVDTTCREFTSGGLADESEHTAMMIAVGMAIEQIASAHLIEVGQTPGVASFAHVDHAFEHGPTLPVSALTAEPAWVVACPHVRRLL